MKNLGRTQMALAGLALGAFTLLAVNLFSHTLLTGARLDLTADRLFTLSDGTRTVLKSLQEPLTARLYFSKILGERSARHGQYYGRVRELLERYSQLSGGRLKLELYDPEPFSDAEDRAVAAGLQGVPVTESGDSGYFGLVVVSSTDLEGSIPFFNLERENFVEYDLTKLIYTVANPKKKTVGLLSTLPIDGKGADGMMGAKRRWAIMDQIREFFEVREIPIDANEIPKEVDTLMVVHPKGLSDITLYAIDQFVLRGGSLLAFVDPNAELEGSGPPELQVMPNDKLEFNRLLESWGLRLTLGKVAGDLEAALRISKDDDPRRPQTIDHVAWLGLGKANLDAADIVVGDIEKLHMPTPGILEILEGSGLQATPVLTTGLRSMAIDTAKVQGESPDLPALLRGFKPEGRKLVLAARVAGSPKTAFKDGKPAYKESERDKAGKPTQAAAGPQLMEAAKPANLLVVADADMLFDAFWVQTRTFFGQKVQVPLADNGAFVVNALDVLSGSDALVGLRARGRTDRPFTLVDDIRKQAETHFRAKEEELQAKLKALQDRLAQLQKKGKDGPEAAAMVTPEDKTAIAQSRSEMVAVRQELRAVQRELRRDIESLEARLKFINIAGLPLLLGLGTLVLWIVRRRRKEA
ncbi:MAG: Gldg family protein [Magnetospirillum sp. WYHS-4]